MNTPATPAAVTVPVVPTPVKTAPQSQVIVPPTVVNPAPAAATTTPAAPVAVKTPAAAATTPEVPAEQTPVETKEDKTKLALKKVLYGRRQDMSMNLPQQGPAFE